MTPDESPIYEALGRNLRARRKAKDIHQDEMARLMEICPSMLCQIEKGKKRMHLHLLWSMADVLGCEPWELLPGFGEGKV